MFEQYFERFTKRVKTVLELARQNAIRYGHAQIETEDVLLGLIEEGQGMGVAVLHFLKVDPEHIRFELEKTIRVGIPLLSSGEIPLSPGVKRVLALSYRQAQYFGHSYVGTEHLLIGLVAEEEGYASKILTRFGLTVDNIRKAIENLLWGEPENISKGKQQSTQHISQPHTKSKTPTIDSYGRDLTQLAEEKKLDPVIGREKEIERVTQILCRRKKNNPVLLGEAGVGKTAIVEGFAQRIASGNIPEILRNKRIIMIDLASLVAGTKYRGEFEQRVKLLLDEIKQSKNIIIFIDELHTLVGAGGAEGAIDASNILKPALSRGEIQCIGATTFDEYRKYIEKDAALERRFQPVVVNPPSVQETIEILRGLRPKYEEHHKLKITDEALILASKLADRYITGRYLPDKAIDLVDEAASRQRLLFPSVPTELEELEKRATQLANLQEQATIQQDFEKAARIRDRLREIRSRINEVKLSWEKSQPDTQRTVTGREIADIVSKWTGIPLSQLCKEEREKLLEMEEHLHKVVVGQDEAISAVSRAIRRSRTGVKDQKRPIGSFLFLGPTGVGKTLLARALAEFLFGDDQALIQIDMSEYMEKFAISRLIGAPPGYVGYEEGGQLTEKVRRRPYSVVLLDEIEKAHPDVFNLLLQVLEEGRLTDSFGRSVSFQNGILILTSNIGTQHLKNRSTIGFQDNKEEMPYSAVKERILDEVKKTFRPEFLNRLDEIIVFHPLEQKHLLKIVDLEVEKVAERLKEQGFTISLTSEAREFLKNMGTDPQFGARPLRRAISRYLEDPLSEEILRESFPQNSHILVKCDKNRLIFTVTERKEHVTTTTDKSPVSPD
ncbi:MAG: ATP-dependent Clp protease ATP-binding subunit [Candidatus Ratteibacteria bacterium]